MRLPILLLLFAMMLTGGARAQAPLLHVLVDASTEMPQAQIAADRVTGGLAHDLALALGERLGREVRFRVLPRRRVGEALLAGERADLLCNYLPPWLPAGLQWSQPFLPDAVLVISLRRGAAPQGLADLADQPIGTVAGFVYPEFEQALGPRFRREDAPNVQANLRKLAADRMAHAIIGRTSFEYLQRRDPTGPALHAPLLVSSYKTRCALSPRSDLKLAALNAAIAALEADGGLQRLLARYR
jgi:ABC-type amino acid transport substrate-binding protein